MKKLLLLTVFFTIITMSGCNEEKSVPGFIDKFSYIEKENGWISELVIEESTVGDTKGELNFDFSGVNLKYKQLDGIYAPIIDKDGNEVQQIETNIPSYIHNQEIKDEVKAISAFLTKKQFREKISKEDLGELPLSYFPYEDIVTLVNNALEDKYADKGFGKYNISAHNCVQKKMKDDSIIQVSYSDVYGYIRVLNIEYIYANGTYLSDLVYTGEATSQQNEAMKSINEIEKEIVDTQELNYDDVISPIEDKEEFNTQLRQLLTETIIEQ